MSYERPQRRSSRVLSRLRPASIAIPSSGPVPSSLDRSPVDSSYEQILAGMQTFRLERERLLQRAGSAREETERLAGRLARLRTEASKEPTNLALRLGLLETKRSLRDSIATEEAAKRRLVSPSTAG